MDEMKDKVNLGPFGSVEVGASGLEMSWWEWREEGESPVPLCWLAVGRGGCVMD